VFQQKENFILPFAVNVMLNLSNAKIGAPSIIQTGECEHLHRLSSHTEKAWLNGCVATKLKEEKKWCFWSLYFLILKRSKYHFANGSERSRPDAKAAVCRSPVTKLNIRRVQMFGSRWQNHYQELKFNQLVGSMWTERKYCTLPCEEQIR